MTKLFADSTRGLFLNVDISTTNPFEVMELENGLAEWLRREHSHLYNEIEFWDEGSVDLGVDTITFSGDNGVICMNAIDVETYN